MSRGGRLSKGKNAIRQIHADRDSIADEIYDARTRAARPLYSRAVVEDVVINPSILSDTQKDEIRKRVKNPELVDIMPRNSAMIRVLTDAEDKRDSRPEIALPFFPPHISLPIHPGEQGWVYYDDPSGLSEFGYWVCRPSEFLQVDDLNFSHSDRGIYQGEARKSTAESAGAVDQEDSERGEETDKGRIVISKDGKPGFPNGGASNEDFTLAGVDDYENISNDSLGNKISTYEPVARFTKRPGDFVLHGSNNSLICLGEDRVSDVAIFDPDGNPTGKSESDLSGLSGMIDFVTGRGRFLPGSDDEDPENTSPRIITNTRDSQEVDKDPSRSEKSENPNEGDPDFTHDASRFYIAMRTNGDTNFNIPSPKKSDNSPETSSADNSAFIVAKSDNVRIIARKDDENEINGSIIIVKEGSSNDDLSAIVLHPDGTAQLDAPKIVLGRNDSGTDSKVEGATGIVKYSEYKKRMDEAHDLISDLRDQVQSLSQILIEFLAAQAGATAGPFPVGVLQGTGPKSSSQIGIDLIKELGIIKAKIEESKLKVPDARSSTIFGE